MFTRYFCLRKIYLLNSFRSVSLTAFVAHYMQFISRSHSIQMTTNIAVTIATQSPRIITLSFRLQLISGESKGTKFLFSVLQIPLLALTVIMTNVNRIEMAPTKITSKDNYLTRAWGESSVPFTVIYSNYARTHQKNESTNTKTTTTTTTTSKPPIPQNRQKKTTTTTKRPTQLSNLFVSNGWGPLG